jgi:hypothetical protein
MVVGAVAVVVGAVAIVVVGGEVTVKMSAENSRHLTGPLSARHPNTRYWIGSALSGTAAGISNLPAVSEIPVAIIGPSVAPQRISIGLLGVNPEPLISKEVPRGPLSGVSSIAGAARAGVATRSNEVTTAKLVNAPASRRVYRCFPHFGDPCADPTAMRRRF